MGYGAADSIGGASKSELARMLQFFTGKEIQLLHFTMPKVAANADYRAQAGLE